MNNKLEGNFNKGVSFIVFFSMLAQACSAQIPTEVSPTFNPQSTEVGGERAEDVNVTDLLAVKQEMTQEEIESFNSKLQDPEKEVVTYDPLGNDLYTPRKILPESRKEAVFSAVEKWVMGESERVFGHTVIDGENMIITESGDRLVTLVEVDLVMGQDLSARGFARIGEDGVTLVPEILFGSDGKPYVNDGRANFYRLSEDSKILETIDVGELSKEHGGGTLVRNSRMRFKNGVEFVVTPEGTLVSTEWFNLQEKVAASGETFDPAKAIFDAEGGFSYPGYTLDEATGEWGVDVVTPEEQLDLDLERWGMTLDEYNVEYDKEGKIELRKKGTNKLIYWDGKWSNQVIVDMVIATNDCQETKFVPASKSANWTSEELRGEFSEYRVSIIRKVIISSFFKIENSDFYYIAVPFKNTNNCWGFWLGKNFSDWTHLAWPKADGEVNLVDIFISELHE